MTVHAAIAAVPKTGTPNRTLLQALLVTRLAYVLGDAEDPVAFDPRGEGGAVQTLVIGYQGQWFWYDEADATTGHDGTTCIVTSATGSRYKVFGVDLLITSVISQTETVPPDPDDVDEEARPNNGDAYIVPTAAVGDWSGWDDSVAVWIAARLEWFRISPKAGWAIAIPGSTRDIIYRYDSVQLAWIAGDGASVSADSVPLNAIIGTAGSLTIRVQNQTTYAPPGSRKTGATPTMPLGGTASNINDNSDATIGVSSAIGDKTGATVVNRIVGRLALASATTLIAIEVRGALGSAASTASAMGLYYSTDNGSNWTQAGAGFTLSTSAQNIQRTGSFVGVTDVALVTEAKNWAANTNTLSGLNAFDATVTATVGDAYVAPSNGIGIFAGMTGRVMICEVANTFTDYAPATGDQVYDVGAGIGIRWDGGTSAWVPTSGAIIARSISPYETGVGSTPWTNAGTYSYSNTVAPTIAQNHIQDDLAVAVHSASAVSTARKLRITYTADYLQTISGGGIHAFGIRRNNETDLIDWHRATYSESNNDTSINLTFWVPITSTSQTTYTFCAMGNTALTANAILARRFMEVVEYA